MGCRGFFILFAKYTKKLLTWYILIVYFVYMKAIDIKNIRIGLKLSQERFATKVGVSRNTVASWEIGRRIPSVTAQKIIKLLVDYGGELPGESNEKLS